VLYYYVVSSSNSSSSSSSSSVVKSQIQRVAYIMHLGLEKCVQDFDGETQRKALLGRRSHIWKYNIKMSFKRMSWENVEWIVLTRDTEKCQTVVKAVMKLPSSGNAGNFLTI
jgi:hypothetical protein